MKDPIRASFRRELPNPGFRSPRYMKNGGWSSTTGWWETAGLWVQLSHGYVVSCPGVDPRTSLCWGQPGRISRVAPRIGRDAAQRDQLQKGMELRWITCDPLSQIPLRRELRRDLISLSVALRIPQIRSAEDRQLPANPRSCERPANRSVP